MIIIITAKAIGAYRLLNGRQDMAALQIKRSEIAYERRKYDEHGVWLDVFSASDNYIYSYNRFGCFDILSDYLGD